MSSLLLSLPLSLFFFSPPRISYLHTSTPTSPRLSTHRVACSLSRRMSCVGHTSHAVTTSGGSYMHSPMLSCVFHVGFLAELNMKERRNTLTLSDMMCMWWQKKVMHREWSWKRKGGRSGTESCCEDAYILQICPHILTASLTLSPAHSPPLLLCVVLKGQIQNIQWARGGGKKRKSIRANGRSLPNRFSHKNCNAR